MAATAELTTNHGSLVVTSCSCGPSGLDIWWSADNLPRNTIPAAPGNG